MILNRILLLDLYLFKSGFSGFEPFFCEYDDHFFRILFPDPNSYSGNEPKPTESVVAGPAMSPEKSPSWIRLGLD